MRAMTPFQALNLLLPIAQPFAGALATAFGIGMTNQEMTRLSETPVVPAGYAFAIWGPLFLAAITYGIWQALPSQRDNPLLVQVRPPLAWAFALNNAWMLVSQLAGNGWHLVIILFSAVACLLVALDMVVRADPRRGVDRWLVRPLVGVWAGWASAAAFANVSITARWAEFGWFGLSETGAAVLVIATAVAGGAAALRWMRGDLGYAFALVWALAAIVVGNTWQRAENPAVVVTAAAGIAVVIVVAVLADRRAAPTERRAALGAAPAARPR